MTLLPTLPFLGLLLSIAMGPVLFPHIWEKHYGKITCFWVICVALLLGKTAPAAFLHTLIEEYIPFITLLFTLYTLAGGLVLRGNLHGSPLVNVGLLALGTILASFLGTTGAAMVLIRPLIRANDNRRQNTHVFVFFIFLVANIGGSLTPFGDPPLFIGFIKGVDFFWTLRHLWPMMLVAVTLLLLVFYALDRYFYKKDEAFKAILQDPTPDSRFSLVGKINLILIALVMLTTLLATTWPKTLWGGSLPNFSREVIFLVLAFLSWQFTPKTLRQENGFNFGPILEVAKLFIGIFLTMLPVIAMLQLGEKGAFAPLVKLVTLPNGAPNLPAWFWISGGLSSFLDNAPTYLMFFELAGGNAQELMTAKAPILVAISLGCVFMGANSYIGNAPNFMVYAIAKEAGVKMPSFFGYMAWSSCILIPLFLLLTVLFF